MVARQSFWYNIPILSLGTFLKLPPHLLPLWPSHSKKENKQTKNSTEEEGGGFFGESEWRKTVSLYSDIYLYSNKITGSSSAFSTKKTHHVISLTNVHRASNYLVFSILNMIEPLIITI